MIRHADRAMSIVYRLAPCKWRWAAQRGVGRSGQHRRGLDRTRRGAQIAAETAASAMEIA